jgi:hypothetical protein
MRTLRRDVLTWLSELQQDIDLLRQDVLGETDDVAVGSE